MKVSQKHLVQLFQLCSHWRPAADDGLQLVSSERHTLTPADEHDSNSAEPTQLTIKIFLIKLLKFL